MDKSLTFNNKDVNAQRIDPIWQKIELAFSAKLHLTLRLSTVLSAKMIQFGQTKNNNAFVQNKNLSSMQKVFVFLALNQTSGIMNH